MKSRKVLYSVICACLVLAVGIAIFAVQKSGDEDNGKLIIPSADEIERNGYYPTNANGETYGPSTGLEEIPDLILATNSDGVTGYVKRTDVRGLSPVNNPEEAMAYMAEGEHKSEVPMYLQDGETVIGTFMVGNQWDYEKE